MPELSASAAGWLAMATRFEIVTLDSPCPFIIERVGARHDHAPWQITYEYPHVVLTRAGMEVPPTFAEDEAWIARSRFESPEVAMAFLERWHACAPAFLQVLDYPLVLVVKGQREAA